MSEGIIVALISVAGAVIGAAITAFGSIAAAERKNDSSKMGCGLLGFIASAGALGGLILGAVFAVLLTQFTGSTTSTIEPNTNIQSPNPVLAPTIRTNSAGSNMPTLYQTEFLGEWLYQQPRSPMPPPASSGQIIFAHGDIDNSGTCHVKEFRPGEQVIGLGLGSFKLWLITGDTEYIQEVTGQIQRGAASHAGTDCPYLP